MAFRGKVKEIEHEKLCEHNPVTTDNIMGLSANEFRLWAFLRFDALEQKFDERTNYILALLLIILGAIVRVVVL